MEKVFIGTSGYNYDYWKGVFYPEDISKKEWLSFYAKHFDTVEINATFYGNFKKSVFEKWGREVSKNFSFCLKGPRFITHVKRLKNVDDSLKVFLGNASGLGSKLKIILWQFPKSFKFSDENLERLEKFLSTLKNYSPPRSRFTTPRRWPNGLLRGERLRHAIEFRDDSWFNIFDFLNKNKSGFVINDSSFFPKKEISTAGFTYIRFHGPGSLYSSNYSYGELKVWAQKIKKFQKLGEVYCYFNNDVGGFAIKNAQQLKEILQS